jgi:hypothetical protein
LSSKNILDLRFGPLELWFPDIRERHASRAFWTVLQESFHKSYHLRNIALADQRRLRWDELERAAGILIRPLFERFDGFIHLFSKLDRVVIS